MKLRKLLLEITVDDALKLFGLTNDDLGDTTKIKAAYKQAAIKNHPDRGGSTIAMQNVNDALEVLNKAQKSTSSRFDWKKAKEENLEFGKNIFKQMKESFKPEIYIKYFESIYNDKFDYKITRERQTDEYYTGFTAVFSNTTNDIILELTFSVYITQAKHDSGLGSGIGNISYPLGITANGLFNDKKLKISQSDYSSTRNHDVFTNPELTFPKAKLEKNKKTSATKLFKKQDMIAYLTKKYGMSWDGEDCRKTFNLDKKVQIVFRRSTFMKMAIWNVNVSHSGAFDRKIPYTSLPETIKVAKFMGDLVEGVSKFTTVDEFVNYVAEKVKAAKSKEKEYWT